MKTIQYQEVFASLKRESRQKKENMTEDEWKL